MILIDGSAGEGGGQVLRTALSLSLVTGQPFRIENIRAKREKPGLLRQHLTAVLAAGEIGRARMEGATLGSKTLTFAPTKVRAGEYHFAIGSAGSGTLVFQTILPALMTAPGSSHLVIEGGTHNMHAPPFDFLEKAFLPVIHRMGPKVSLRLERYGFFPAGGGRFTADIEPCAKLNPMTLTKRGEVTHRRAVAIVANLPRHIAQREIDTLRRLLDWRPEELAIIETKNAAGPGNVVLMEIGSEAIFEVFSGFGRRGVKAEQVASEAAASARSYLTSSGAVSEHLADQLLLPLALSGGGSFTTSKLTLHASTNMGILSLFLPVSFATQDQAGFVQVEVRPK